MVCLVCKKPIGSSGSCRTCRLPYDGAWSVGERKDTLQRLIGLYKFKYAREAYRVLGDLLIEILPDLPADTIIVPVPTVSSHIRQRGYDHTLLIADYIAKKRGLQLRQLLARRTRTIQRHASASVRHKQAKAAFMPRGHVTIPNHPYLLIDDVATTGSTLIYVTKILKDMGASQVMVAAIAYQTLD
ncbi:MAG: putative Phosphoribosyltransferase [Candidatus Saccharibacteria bacterium]|nr:putative Phosphoribosyltransferase [Candidatus Saccharibacteria bacterium]